MHKNEFITHKSKQHSCTKIEAEKTIDMFISSVIDALRNCPKIN
jgi:nucleoid DNA-binding protein